MLPATVEAVAVHLITGETDPALRPFAIERFHR
jgi:hypothetical protein